MDAKGDWTRPNPDGEKGRKKERIRDNRRYVNTARGGHVETASHDVLFSALYRCVHGTWLFFHLKNCHCLRTFASEDREWGASRGGGRPHANDAIVNLQAGAAEHWTLSDLTYTGTTHEGSLAYTSASRPLAASALVLIIQLLCREARIFSCKQDAHMTMVISRGPLSIINIRRCHSDTIIK